ncbi:MAG: hypothetical protein OEV00_08485 [Acidobacteriota bacterium]|nr:hypothetical protein [Acidobacteriota bacterium]MDH3785346.1 hypothetical protein [Acidobacteriota bacterium]
MAERSPWAKFFMWGCGGCAGLLLIAAIVAVVLVMVGKSQAGNEQSVSETFGERPPAPSAPATPETRSDAVAVPAGAPARVIVEFQSGEFHLSPGRAGEPIGVDAEYDSRRYTLEQTATTDEDGVWTYRIALSPGGTAGGPSILARLFGASSPSLRVTLPPDVLIQLDTSLTACGGEVDVGGLWLRDSRFAFNKAGVSLRVSEPLKEPIGSLDLDLSMAGGEFSRIGNASPSRLNFNIRMAGGVLDLRGDWKQDSDIVISAPMAGAEVILPADVLVEGIDSQPLIAPSTDGGQPLTLRIQSDASSDDVRFRRM